MKYFKNELWDKMNTNNIEEKNTAHDQWMQNIKEYEERYRLLENRLSKKSFNLLKQNFLHDYRMNDFTICHKDLGRQNPISIDITFTNSQEIWMISYKKVNKLEINYLKQKGFYSERGFDTLGYYELLDIDEETLSHEFLFASGTTLLIYFSNKNIFISKQKIQKLNQYNNFCRD